MIQTPDYMTLLSPSVLSRFSQMPILARGFVDGYKNGDHRSLYLGSSTEFAEHREYSPGDDPRGLDWRVFGKMDRYYVKQYVEETNLRATVLLDASASMGFVGDSATDVTGRRLSKFSYAQHLAAAIAYLLTRQGDAVGLFTFDSQVRDCLPAAGKASHLRRLLQVMHRTRPGGESKLADVLNEIALQIPRRGLVVVISDFFDDVEDITASLHHLRHRKHELILCHVLADEEISFPYSTATKFRDLEQVVGHLDIDPEAIRREYLSQFSDYLQKLEAACGHVEADYVQLCTKNPYEKSLADYLASRLGR
ncbi:MAG: DUF58 domain-containing protein [Planctomycetota bacterium]